MLKIDSTNIPKVWTQTIHTAANEDLFHTSVQDILNTKNPPFQAENVFAFSSKEQISEDEICWHIDTLLEKNLKKYAKNKYIHPSKTTQIWENMYQIYSWVEEFFDFLEEEDFSFEPYYKKEIINIILEKYGWYFPQYLQTLSQETTFSKDKSNHFNNTFDALFWDHQPHIVGSMDTSENILLRNILETEVQNNITEKNITSQAQIDELIHKTCFFAFSFQACFQLLNEDEDLDLHFESSYQLEAIEGLLNLYPFSIQTEKTPNNTVVFSWADTISAQSVSALDIALWEYGGNVVNIPLCPEFISEEVPKFLEANSQLISQILNKVHKQIRKNYHVISRDLEHEAKMQKQAEIFIDFIEKTFLALKWDPKRDFEYQNYDLFNVVDYLTARYLYRLTEKNLLQKYQQSVENFHGFIDDITMFQDCFKLCKERNMFWEFLNNGERDFFQMLNVWGISFWDTENNRILMEKLRNESYEEMQIALLSISHTLDLLITHPDWEIHITDNQLIFLLWDLLEDFQEIYCKKLKNLFIWERELWTK